MLTKRGASSSPGHATAALAKDRKRRTLETLTSVRLMTSTNRTQTAGTLKELMASGAKQVSNNGGNSAASL